MLGETFLRRNKCAGRATKTVDDGDGVVGAISQVQAMDGGGEAHAERKLHNDLQV